MVAIPPPGEHTCVIETPDGLVLRVPVLRIDETEALLDTPTHVRTQEGWEVIVERADGHAEVLHTRVVRSGEGGLLLRWDFRHPSEMSSLDRVLAPPDRAALPAGRDVPLDIGRALESRSRMVRTSKIAAQRDSVRVLKLDVVRELIEAAVDEALAASPASIDEEERQRLLEESEHRFQELLAREKAEKQDLASQRESLAERLERARGQLETELGRSIGVQTFTLSDQGILEIERRIGERLDRAIARGSVTPEFERELRGVVEGLLDRERERLRELAQQAQNDRVSLLEQKIARLARSLDETVRDRDRIRERARALESAGGTVHNVYQPGIDGEDPEKQRKLAVLAELVRENHDLRRSMEESGRGIPRIHGPLAAGSDT